MVLKRKRSESELSGLSFSSSPSRPNTAMETYSAAGMASPSSSSYPFGLPRSFATPAHLPSRTFKRFRNNRPSEEEVHQHTLGLLYSAQQQQQRKNSSSSVTRMNLPMTVPAPVIEPWQQPQQQQDGGAAAQRSLHSFWNIRSAPSLNSSTPSVDADMSVPLSCEDCGVSLRSGGDSMDVDGYGLESDSSCGPCGRRVCGHCSVSNLGERRTCLQCAGRKVWVGGIGWTTAPGVAVC